MLPIECRRLDHAISTSIHQLRQLKSQVGGTQFAEHTKILEAHELMLQDDLLVRGTKERINAERINAEWALQLTLDQIAEFFGELEDGYIRERATDVETVGERIMRNLTGEHFESLIELLTRVEEPSILVSERLTPADAVQLFKTNVVGFCIDEGTRTTHTAIAARSLEIPAVVGAHGLTEQVGTGDVIALDGDAGEVVIRPSDAQREAYVERDERLRAVRDRLDRKRSPITSSNDGFEVSLAANIDLLGELDAVDARGAQGIGLFRTEYLFMNRTDLPTEDEQFEAYRDVLLKVAPHPATIRTVDIGGDKLELPKSMGRALNPFFGMRALRYCLKERSLFRSQIRALLRASAYGKLRLLLPFVTDVTEVREAKRLIQDAEDELRREGHDVSDTIELGILIEIPAAALIADVLAREVDFFSVGTNDLIQYTLAAARDIAELGYLYHPLHPAVLRIIRLISDAAHREGIRLSMCGEMAGEPLYAVVLLGYRFHELSMTPASIPVVREIIRRTSLAEARTLADRVQHLGTYSQVDDDVRRYMNNHFPDLIPLLIGD
jgi:phosphotransferase system enzyme I (PtsI)